LLERLFEKVFVPIAVHEELTDAKTPEIVRRRVASLPSWFKDASLSELSAFGSSRVVKSGTLSCPWSVTRTVCDQFALDKY